MTVNANWYLNDALVVDSDAECTEIEMVTLIVQEALATLKTEEPVHFGQLIYCPINTQGNPNRAAADCVKTADTTKRLRETLEMDAQVFQTLSKPIVILAASIQPFVERQCRDMARQLGEEYQVIGIGKAFSRETFNSLPTSNNICLGEVARLVNIAFTTKPMTAFQHTLFEEERRELSLLLTPPLPTIGEIPRLALARLLPSTEAPVLKINPAEPVSHFSPVLGKQSENTSTESTANTSVDDLDDQSLIGYQKR